MPSLYDRLNSIRPLSQQAPKPPAHPDCLVETHWVDLPDMSGDLFSAQVAQTLTNAWLRNSWRLRACCFLIRRPPGCPAARAPWLF